MMKELRRIKVLIADDHILIREGLKQLIIKNDTNIEIVGEASNGWEVLQKVKDLKPHVALVDIGMPRLNGLEATRMIKEHVPETQVVIISMYSSEAYVHESLESGALGYVLKISPLSDIINAIKVARQGEYFLCSVINKEVIDVYLKNRQKNNDLNEYNLLTEREQQVFRLIVQGNSTQEIAENLNISPKTVEKHRSNIMKKLNLHDIISMVKYAIKIGIIDPEIWIH